MSEFILDYVTEDKGRFFAGYYKNFCDGQLQFRVQGEGQSAQEAKNNAMMRKALGLCFTASTQNLPADNRADFDYKKIREVDEMKRRVFYSASQQ